MTGVFDVIIFVAILFMLCVLRMRWRPVVKEYLADSSRFIFYLTGDGGYSTWTKKVCRLLQAHHYNVISWDTRYFWGGRTLAQAVDAFEQIVNRVEFPKELKQITVIGYSFGADLTPFILNNLSSTLRNQISEVMLLSPSKKGELKIDLMTLLFPTHSGELDIVSEINKLKLPVTVILNDHDSFADSDFREGLTVKRLPGNHHFDGQYERVVETIVELMDPSQQLKD